VGSIPFHYLCLGGLLTFIALWVMAYAGELSTSNGKESNMKTETTKNEKSCVAIKTFKNTIWAIGTSWWAGALSG
jgi:hypothetical protein